MTNPWLSAWLSAANTMAGATRSFWTAEMARQQTAMMNEATRQTLQFWTQTAAPPPQRRTKRKR